MPMNLYNQTKVLFTITLFLSIFLIYYVFVNNAMQNKRWDRSYGNVAAYNFTNSSFHLKLNFSEQEKCNETRSLVYVKTHKTASTVVNDILRKVMRSSVQLFPTPFIGGYPGLFNDRFVMPAKRASTMRMIAGHFRFNKPAIQSLMPTIPKYVTIIRHPLRQFESAFHFYYTGRENSKALLKMIPCFATPYFQVLSKFNASFTEYIDAAVTSLNDSIPWYFRSRNYQSFDLGMDPKKTDDEPYIRSYVEELDSTFDLVMIQDYFLESLVLLRETLCLDWDKLRFVPHPTSDIEKHVFTEEEKLKLQTFLRQDFILYDHMNKTFWKKVEKYGPKRMENDVAVLKARIEKYQKGKMNAVRKRRKAKKLLEKIDDDELSKSDIRKTNNNLENLWARIREGCPCEMMSGTVWQLTEYMADSGGYCPW